MSMPHKHDDYDYFEDSKFVSKIGKVLSSFIICVDLEVVAPSDMYTRFGCDLAIWFQDNGGIDDIEYIQQYDSWYIMFSNEKKARKFNRWYNKYRKLDTSSKRDLWLTYDDFKKSIEHDGNIIISDSIKYNLSNWLNVGTGSYLAEVTFELFELYKWMAKNLNGKIWHWGEHFRFELKEDAVTFKLYNTPKETDDA